ncbi:hypothetical protein [Motiliproteus sp. MSK22-1]|uniref:hypothetical protein n=1 Tax=Motiliproteus sp. MSK22-1 TaxID=1897630 RepID=UPI0009784165|nr:hypothetical protein [Motiliproteus sp. MSK22-1]OMH26625.1 hypothetical protein BGP75_23295 [Motiliproteus sp. MSK22-1]
MTLIMKNKVDIYLQHPERFQLDLLNQKSIWMDNVVRPLGSHYEDSKKQIDAVIKIADQRKKAQIARLKKIELYHDIVMGVLFFGIDIIAAGALKNVSVLSKKYSSNKDFETLMKSSDSFEKAMTQFMSQKASIVDNIVANFDDKVKGLASTGTVKSAGQTVKSLSASVQKTLPATVKTQWAGPQKFQNELETFYSSTCRSINEVFVDQVRDSKASADRKKSIIKLLVNLPFTMPPTLSLKSFGDTFAAYFELCYWVRLVAATAQQKGHFGTIEGYLADVINERVLHLSGHHFTHRGGQKIKSVNMYSKWGNMPLGKLRNKDIRMVWDGWCSNAHASYGKLMLKDAKLTGVDAIFICQGISCQQAYK